MAMGMIEEKQQPEGGSRYLPVGVAAGILRRLPARSVARLRCVCKQWRSLTHDHIFIHEHRRLWASERHILLGSFWLIRGLRLYKFGPDHDIFEVSLHKPDEPIYNALSNPVNGLIAALCESLSPESRRYQPYLINHITWDHSQIPESRLYQPYLINPITGDHSQVPGGIFQVNSGPKPEVGLGFDAGRGVYKLVSLQSRGGLRPVLCMVLTVGADGAGGVWKDMLILNKLDIHRRFS